MTFLDPKAVLQVPLCPGLSLIIFFWLEKLLWLALFPSLCPTAAGGALWSPGQLIISAGLILWVALGTAPAKDGLCWGHPQQMTCPPRSPAVAGAWVSVTHVSKDSTEVFCV